MPARVVEVIAPFAGPGRAASIRGWASPAVSWPHLDSRRSCCGKRAHAPVARAAGRFSEPTRAAPSAMPRGHPGTTAPWRRSPLGPTALGFRRAPATKCDHEGVPLGPPRSMPLTTGVCDWLLEQWGESGRLGRRLRCGLAWRAELHGRGWAPSGRPRARLAYSPSRRARSGAIDAAGRATSLGEGAAR